MVKFSDSTRRLVTFLLIVLVGSALLIFDIPILYLLIVMLFIALIFALFTGMLILSEVIADLRERFKEYSAKMKIQTAKDRSEKKKEAEEKKAARKKEKEEKAAKAKETKEKGTKEKAPKEKGAGLFGGLFSKFGKKKETSPKADKTPDGGSTGGESPAKAAGSSDLNLDDFELDLDLDAELEGLEPEIGEVRTPYGAEDPMANLPSERVTSSPSNLDTSPPDDDDDDDFSSFDSNFGDDDDISSIYANSMDIGENEGEDMLANMEGGISAGDLAAYNSSDDSPYDYGGDDGNEEEQYEAGGSGGGMDDDDLLASLKSDIDDLKKKDDNVLLRDLKNLKFTAQELVDELNEIVDIITKSKKR